MEQALTISALAKWAGVTSKTLRYWERVGLLPKATRTHTGYRVFGPEAIHYIDFILKAKSVGLTLSEMKRVRKPHLLPRRREGRAQATNSVVEDSVGDCGR